jgi:hypothetical protein
VALLEHRKGLAAPVAAVLEVMSRPRGELVERLAEYGLRLRRELPYQRGPTVRFDVVGAVLNLTGPAQPDRWSIVPAGLGGLGLWGKVSVRTLRDVGAREALERIARGEWTWALLAFLPLMAGADEAEVLTAWREQAGKVEDERKRIDLGGLARIFADLAGRTDVWRKGLEGWGVERSPVVLEWEARGAARTLKAVRESLLQLMRDQFQPDLPADLVAAVNTQTEPAKLTAWAFRMAKAGSLEEARKVVGLP